MSRLGKLGIKMFGPGAIIAAIQNENPEELANECADFIDERLDNQLGNAKSATVTTILIPFANKFVMSFTKRLLERMK